MHFAQGDIVIVMFPFTGQGESKARPAIVVSNSIVNKTSDIVLAQITSTLRADDLSFPITKKHLTKPLEEDRQCEVRCHKLFTAEKDIVKRKISSLTKEKIQELQAKITRLFEVTQ